MGYFEELQKDAEKALLELVRHKDAKNFTVEISVDNGRWHFRFSDHDSGVCGDGSGKNFGQAYHDVADPSLRPPGGRQA
jgi:hypothetical protein